MAVEIQLPERRAIGPTRVGRAKPGFDLADSGLQETGKAITEFAMFAGKHFDDIRKAKTANEEAEGLGAFKGLVESFNTFSKANPNASPEQLRAEWGKVKSQINKLPSQIGTSSESKENLTSVFANNMKLAEQKAHTFAAAVGSAQQRVRYEAQRDLAIGDLDPIRLREIDADAIQVGLVDPDIIEPQQNQDIARMEAVKEKERLRVEKEIAKVEFQEEYDDLTNMALGTLFPGTSTDFGKRADGTDKGTGFLGVLKRPDGGVSTEISIGVQLEANDGKETEIPTIISTTKGKELKYLLGTPIDQLTTKDPELWDTIVQKAVDHANKRVKEGKSPFKEPEKKATSEPVQTDTQEAYDKLPSGTRYRDADGNIGVKP